jgi:hypothetical protein
MMTLAHRISFRVFWIWARSSQRGVRPCAPLVFHVADVIFRGVRLGSESIEVPRERGTAVCLGPTTSTHRCVVGVVVRWLRGRGAGDRGVPHSDAVFTLSAPSTRAVHFTSCHCLP